MSTTLSCGECGTPLRVDQLWCSLCYAPVAEPFDPLTAPLEAVLEQAKAATQAPVSAEAATRGAEELAADVGLLTSHRDIQVARSQATSGEESEDVADVSEIDVMLSMLAAEHKAMDPAAGLSERLGDRSTRIAVMVGGTAIIGGLLFSLLTLFGAIF